MNTLFACPCGQQFAVPPQNRGRHVRCPRCARVLSVPLTGPAPRRPAAGPSWPVYAAAAAVLAAAGAGVLLYVNLSAPPADERPPATALASIDKSSPPPSKPPARPPSRPPHPPPDEPMPPAPPAPKPTKPAEDDLAPLLARLNAWRAAAGLAPATLDPALSRGCQAHARYVARNAARPEIRGRGLFDEDAALPGFTEAGRETARRALVVQREPLDALDDAMASCFGRLPVLAPGLDRLGAGAARTDAGTGVTVLDFAYGAPQTARAPRAVVYPADGQKDVPLSFPGNEVPDPLPQTEKKVAGFPITVTFPPGASVRAAEGKLTDAAGRDVPVWFSSPEKPANPQFAQHQGTSICMIARKVLAPDTTYAVTVSARVGAEPWSRTWRFTTGNPDSQNDGAAERGLARLNALRRAAGLGPLELDEELTRACRAHARYLARNNDRLGPGGLDPNDEDPQAPGFSEEGRRVARRANVGLSPMDPEAMFDRWVSSFGLRGAVLALEARKAGLGCARGAASWCVVLALQAEPGSRREPLLYPADGQQNVPATYEGGESPDPIPDSKDRQAGYPITVTFPFDTAVTAVTAELTLDGAAVPFWISTPEKPVDPRRQRSTVCLIARRPLKPGSTYKVRVAARAGGRAWEKSWSFRTEKDGLEEQKDVAVQALARLNRHRRAAGAAESVLDEELSRGCLAHARYLLRNAGHPSTQGLGIHDEDPKLPGYSEEGRRAGRNAVIIAGGSPAAAVDDWMATFYHRIPLLDPELSRVGFGGVRGGPNGRVTVMDAFSGRGRQGPVLFPLPGQKDVPLRLLPGEAEVTAVPETRVQPSGFPVTATFPGGAEVRGAFATLTDGEGKPVEVWVMSPEKHEPFARANTVGVVPQEPLKPGTTYTVKLGARVAGKVWSREWKFTTVPAER